MPENGKVIVDARIPKIKEQQKRKANKRFIILATVFFIILVVVVYSQSSYSKLNAVHWDGVLSLEEEELMTQADLRMGMPYVNVRLGSIEEQLSRLPEILAVEVERVWPNELAVVIEEYPVVAFWREEEQLFPILQSGFILWDKPWQGNRVQHPILTNWVHTEGVSELAGELSRLPVHIQQLISEIMMNPTYSDPYRLNLYMIDGYEVRTSIYRFAQSMSWYPYFIEQARAEGEEEGILYLFEGDSGWIERGQRNDQEEMTADEEAEQNGIPADHRESDQTE